METLEANDSTAPESGRESSVLSAPHEHENHVPPSHLFDNNDIEGGDQDGILDDVEGAPWSIDWSKVAAEKFNAALEGYKHHTKSLFAAIDTFIKESNAIHSEWTEIYQAECAESQRLDKVEPDVLHAMAGTSHVYGGDLLAGQDDSTSSH